MVGVLSALVTADVAGCSRRELLSLLVAPVHANADHAATPHHIKQVTRQIQMENISGFKSDVSALMDGHQINRKINPSNSINNYNNAIVRAINKRAPSTGYS